MNIRLNTSNNVFSVFYLVVCGFLILQLSAYPVEVCKNSCNGDFDLCQQQASDMKEYFGCVRNEQQCRDNCSMKRRQMVKIIRKGFLRQ